MIENQFFGKLLPANESIMLILEEIRKKYQIPEISPSDDGMEILLRHELEFDWKAIHAEILEKLKKDPDLLTDKARTTYNAIKKMQSTPLEDPEFEKVSKQFKDNTQKLIDLITQQFAPLVDVIDKFFHTIADLSVEYLITGIAREVPESWFFSINVMDAFGEKVIIMQSSSAVDPDEAAEMFKQKYKETYGKRKVKLTEKHIETADYLRMKLEGKSYLYIIEEVELRAPEEFANIPNNRHPSSLRRKNSRIRQRLSRMQKDLLEILS